MLRPNEREIVGQLVQYTLGGRILAFDTKDPGRPFTGVSGRGLVKLPDIKNPYEVFTADKEIAFEDIADLHVRDQFQTILSATGDYRGVKYFIYAVAEAVDDGLTTVYALFRLNEEEMAKLASPDPSELDLHDREVAYWAIA